MKQKIVPAVVTTMRALWNGIRGDFALIFVDNILYWNKKILVHILLVSRGYERVGFPARRGVFYAKGIDVDKCEVYDPCKLC